MTDFVTHDASGRIHSHGHISVPAELVEQTIAAQARDGLRARQGVGHPDTHWVHGGDIELRPAMPYVADKLEIVADGADAVSLSALPPGSTVTLEGQAATTHDATMTITTTLPGTHQVLISCWPYRDLTLEITAHAAP
ncbi:hypothetical protein [Nitrospirillum amazonense]|uniref:hypothetical protein n=1 Tax=Nitrospirillum amazonense TaxID=28077 RepID=UPI0024126438|nr:hypothetical protein [Nitrospirillum amazonense]MDG3444495.1 hypothetical protein [Nitrospirillum amazonense]